MEYECAIEISMQFSQTEILTNNVLTGVALWLNIAMNEMRHHAFLAEFSGHEHILWNLLRLSRDSLYSQIFG